MIRILIADDQRVIRDGLVLLVGLNEGMEVVGSAADGGEAVALVHELHPDVVLMDLNMPGTDGVTATGILRAEAPEVPVLILTTYADDDSIFPVLRAGARGYLTKDASADQIEAAIRALHAGQTWMDPFVQQRLVSVLTALPRSTPQPSTRTHAPAPPQADGLTPRETEVLSLIARGLSNTEIEQQLVLSRATVKTHVNRILAKTGARDRAQAVRYAFQHGLADQ